MTTVGTAKLYELSRMSSGKAARLAEMPLLTFLREADRIGVPAIKLAEDEIGTARELAG